MAKRNLITVILAAVLVAGVAIGGTMAYMTDTAVKTNTFKVGDLELELDEPSWPGSCDLDEFLPGSSVGKDPTVTCITGSAYLRLKVQFFDKNGRLITDTKQLDRIKQTLYYDSNYKFPFVTEDGITYNGSAALKVRADGLNGSAYHYTLAQLTAMSNTGNGPITRWYNTINLELDLDRGNTVWLWYKSNNGIIKEGESVTLFTSIVYPSNWGRTEIEELGGGYSIVITMEAIQASTFATQAQARLALEAAFPKGA